MIDDRYLVNQGSFLTEKDQEKLLEKVIGVVGCGGQGGYILDFLARLGVKELIFCDGDNFDITNLNRQNFSSLAEINNNKAEVIYQNLIDINDKISYKYSKDFLTEDNIELFKGCDIIFVCAELDQKTEQKIKSLKKTIVDAANWSYGAAISIFTPEYLNYYINNIHVKNAVKKYSQTAYSCALTSAIACSEAVKFLLGYPCESIGKVLIYDIFLGTTYVTNYN